MKWREKIIFVWTLLLVAMLLPSFGCDVLAQANSIGIQPVGSHASLNDDNQVKAMFVADPSVCRTPSSVPLLLKIYNNSDKSIRLLNLFTPKLLPAAVHFDLQGGNVNRLGASLFYGEKVSLYSWQYVYITVKPHHAFQTSFDLVQMTMDKQPIPPGKYKLSGFYGANMGYPSGMGSDADVYNGLANIAPIDLVIDKPVAAPQGRKAPSKKPHAAR